MAFEPPTKCCNCNSEAMIEIQHPTGASFAITTVDLTKNPPSYNPASGIPLLMYGCASCGQVLLFNPRLAH